MFRRVDIWGQHVGKALNNYPTTEPVLALGGDSQGALLRVPDLVLILADRATHEKSKFLKELRYLSLSACLVPDYGVRRVGLDRLQSLDDMNRWRHGCCAVKGASWTRLATCGNRNSHALFDGLAGIASE